MSTQLGRRSGFCSSTTRESCSARGKKFGWTTALGRAAFILAARILSWQASARSAEIIRQHDLVRDACGPRRDRRSAAGQCFERDQDSAPPERGWSSTACVLFPKAVLMASDAVHHAGITPKYRGVHGGYWALFHGDGEAACSTKSASIPGPG